MSQQVMASPRGELELIFEDLRALEQLSFESTGDGEGFPLISEISEQRRMAIILLLAEISARRPDYVFSLDSGKGGTI